MCVVVPGQQTPLSVFILAESDAGIPCPKEPPKIFEKYGIRIFLQHKTDNHAQKSPVSYAQNTFFLFRLNEGKKFLPSVFQFCKVFFVAVVPSWIVCVTTYLF